MRGFFKKERQLILNAFRFLDDLSIRPAQYAPVHMHQTILSQELVLIPCDTQGRRDMPLQSIDFKSKAVRYGLQCEIDVAGAPLNVGEGVFRYEARRLIRSELASE